MELVPPNSLVGLESNDLRHSPERMEELRQSIKEEGIQKPIVIIEDIETGYRRISNGHHRLAIALELGLEVVPIAVRYGILDGYEDGKGEHVNQHHVAVRSALKHLYGRISNPTASDQARYRIGLKALGQLGGSEDVPMPDIEHMTVAQVQTLVESGKVSAAHALDLENQGRKRVSLIGWLEARL